MSRQSKDGKIEEDPTAVDVNMKILSINKVDVINMEFTLDMYLRQFWQDDRLRWDDKEYSFYNDSIAIPAKKDNLWLPDLFFRNGKQGYLHEMTQPNYLIRVDPSGNILYSQKVTVKFACQMQLQTFPMDTQICDMNIGSYGYTTSKLLFRWKKDGNKVPVELGEMQISEFNTPREKEIQALDCTKGSATSTGSYACLKVIFKLERQLGSYLSSTYIPAILIVTVSWLNFWISVEAVPARVSLGVLTLLGILTQGMSVINNLPRTIGIQKESIAEVKASELIVDFQCNFSKLITPVRP
uniref:Ig-like domain-containing protein n=1 Tax=Macrostomum lignano TaxID=282301 RepID=A0A1I8J7E9_9PLAT